MKSYLRLHAWLTSAGTPLAHRLMGWSAFLAIGFGTGMLLSKLVRALGG